MMYELYRAKSAKASKGFQNGDLEGCFYDLDDAIAHGKFSQQQEGGFWWVFEPDMACNTVIEQIGRKKEVEVLDFRCDYRDQKIVFYFRDGGMMSIFDVKVTNAVMIAHEILEVSGYDYRTIEKRFHDLQIRFNKSEEANKKLATEANKLRSDNLELAVQLDVARLEAGTFLDGLTSEG